MNSSALRQSFLDFFKSKGHHVVPSASLMPTAPNLLFTNAGMNPFVPHFLEERPAPHRRVVDTQKCIRAGGKHNDLDDVGFDTYHHTFFEMLGNWSFGDYFKEEAIQWAWELLTAVWKLPKERLYASVYKPEEGDPASFDQDAYQFWKAIFIQEGLDPEKHIVFGNQKDNFWMMGETGPCGPCSEIHIDLTPEGDSEGVLVNADSPWCIEIWNLVFMQFNAMPDGSFQPLPNCHVDTGMGFERVAGIFATTGNLTNFSLPPSNYNSDLFTGIFSFLTEKSGHAYQYTLPQDGKPSNERELKDCIFRILADHIRTLSFSIADGILPGNNGRNYVLRRILRRAVMYGQKLGLEEGFFADLFPPLCQIMGSVFPELEKQKTVILKVIRSEEASFNQTLTRGLKRFEKISAEGSTISGKEAFTLYDTYGFPLDLTQILAQERGMQVDLTAFEEEMIQQKTRSRKAQKNETVQVSQEASSEKTAFKGFDGDNLSDFSTVLQAVLLEGKEPYLVFESTPFYAEMGGQVGDTGKAQIDGQSIAILNTIKDGSGRFLHQIDPRESYPSVGTGVVLSVDRDRRREITRHHTATHLLQSALKNHLGDHVQQAGSLVGEKGLRFDVHHFEAVTDTQLQAIELEVNREILKNTPIHSYECAFDDKPQGVTALFGEKYGARVRVVTVGEYSQELCGGTHVGATGEIGFFKILQESAIAAGIRRIEAMVGSSSIYHTQNQGVLLQKLATSLHCPTKEVDQRLEQLLQQKTDLEKQLRGFQQKEVARLSENLQQKAVVKNQLHWVVEKVSLPHPGELKSIGSQLLKAVRDAVIVLALPKEGKITLLVMVSATGIAQGLEAGQLLKTILVDLGGKGGGKPAFAMGGAPDRGNLDSVLQKLRDSSF